MRVKYTSILKVLLALAFVCSFLVVAALVSSVHADGATYYVSTAGNDTTGDGSSTSPWRTIQYAVDQASVSNTRIEVAEGTYQENVLLNNPYLVSLTGGYLYPRSGWNPSVYITATLP